MWTDVDTCTHAVGWLHSLAEISRDVPEKDAVWMDAYVAVPLSNNGAFTDVQVAHVAMVTNMPTHQHRCWLLNFAMRTIWMVISSLAQTTQRPFSPKTI